MTRFTSFHFFIFSSLFLFSACSSPIRIQTTSEPRPSENTSETESLSPSPEPEQEEEITPLPDPEPKPDPEPEPDPVEAPPENEIRLQIESPTQNQTTEGRFKLSGLCTDQFRVGLQISTLSELSYYNCRNGMFSTTIILPEFQISGSKKTYQILVWQDLPQRRIQSTVSVKLNVCPRKEWGSYAVNENYEPNDSGAFCLFRNKMDDGRYNFHQSNNENIPRQIADPHIFVWDKYLYLVGGSGRENFTIYRSGDGVNWRQYGRTFRDDDIPDDGILNLDNRSGNHPQQRRSFRHIWGPELFIDPERPDEIQLYFSATESRSQKFTEGWHMENWNRCENWVSNAPDYDSLCLSPSHSHQLQTSLHASMSLHDFLFNKEDSFFADDKADFFGKSRSNQPHWMTYTTGQDVFNYDGGMSLNREIPTSVSPEFIDPRHIFDPVHWLRIVGKANWWSITHQRNEIQTPWTSMALDSSFFWDYLTGKRWVSYTWTHRGSANRWQGNHIAAYRLAATPYEFSTAPTESIHFLAYKKNMALNVPGTSVPEGQHGLNGKWDEDFGAAEGSFIFYNPNNQQYYSVFSRNVADSQAYAMFGKNASSLEELFLSKGDQSRDNNEYRFLESSDRTTPEGIYFGGGSVFSIVDQNLTRFYVAFHGKFNQAGVCEHRYCRTLYIKELNFDSVTGAIRPLSNLPNQEDLSRDINFYIWPREWR